jgi:endogenous inhibitor of DNA gyrase (YacG/DUF329 family)
MTDSQKSQIAYLRSKGETYAAIAAALDISENTVKSYCQRNGLGKIKTQKGVCAFCGKEMVSKSKSKPKKFCSDKCRAAWWNAHPELSKGGAVTVCAGCKKEFKAPASHRRKFCSHACYINSRFKGGASHDA